MSAADGKTVKIKCATWDQVEAFYTEKLRGNVLVVKMPFRPGIGDGMTVALGLPDGLVFAIDGTVVKIGGEDGGKIPVAVKLFGMTLEVRAQLKRLVANGRGLGTASSAPIHAGPPPRAAGTKPPRPRAPETVPPTVAPRVEDVADEERAAFAALEQTRKRFLALDAHAVLDVPPGADAEALRAGFLARAQRLHPDLYRRYRSPALRALAAETFLLVSRAYERARSAPHDGFLISADPAADAAPATQPPASTSSGESSGSPVEPLRASSASPYSEITITEGASGGSGAYDDELTFTTSTRGTALTAEELFEDAQAAAASGSSPVPIGEPGDSERTPPALAEVTPTPLPEHSSAAVTSPPPSVDEGRSALGDGRYREACEAFAAILRAEPRNRQVRALYHVASAQELRQKGDGVNARLMLETALVYDRNCEEAHRALAVEPDRKSGIFKRLFDR